MKITHSGRVALLALSLFALLIVGGCSHDRKETQITAREMRRHPEPELYSEALTKEQFLNTRARSRSTTWRQIHDDWQKFWLLDEPLRLTPSPVP